MPEEKLQKTWPDEDAEDKSQMPKPDREKTYTPEQEERMKEGARKSESVEDESETGEETRTPG